MRAAIYCRVGTEDQEGEGTSLQTQLEACCCSKRDSWKGSVSGAFVYKLLANIFANELFVTIINKVVPISTT